MTIVQGGNYCYKKEGKKQTWLKDKNRGRLRGQGTALALKTVLPKKYFLIFVLIVIVYHSVLFFKWLLLRSSVNIKMK